MVKGLIVELLCEHKHNKEPMQRLLNIMHVY